MKNERQIAALEEAAQYLEEDMTPLDYWVELHGTTDGFFEQFNVEVQE